MWRVACRDRHWWVLVSCLIQAFLLTGCDALQAQTTLETESSESISSSTRDVLPEYLVLKQASGFIKFSHRNFVADVVQLRDQTQRFCISPDKVSLIQTRMRWVRAMNAWSAIKTINFGPIDELGLSQNFQFWPDPTNKVEQGVRSRVSGHNTELDAALLAKDERASHGLSAIEYLLFDPAVGKLERYQNDAHLCGLLENTVHNLLVSSDRLNRAWQGEYVKRWLFLEQDMIQQGKMKYHVEQMFAGVVMTLADISQQQLAAPLGMKTKAPLDPHFIRTGVRTLEPLRLESWRSKTSLNHIASSLQFARKLYEMKHGLGWYLRTLKLNDESLQSSQSERLALDQVIRDQFKRIEARISSIHSSAFDLLNQNDTQQLDSLYFEIVQLYGRLGVEYAQLAGFNLAPKPELSVRID